MHTDESNKTYIKLRDLHNLYTKCLPLPQFVLLSSQGISYIDHVLLVVAFIASLFIVSDISCGWWLYFF